MGSNSQSLHGDILLQTFMVIEIPEATSIEDMPDIVSLTNVNSSVVSL
jgi:hypothetical protein